MVVDSRPVEWIPGTGQAAGALRTFSSVGTIAPTARGVLLYWPGPQAHRSVERARVRAAAAAKLFSPCFLGHDVHMALRREVGEKERGQPVRGHHHGLGWFFFRLTAMMDGWVDDDNGVFCFSDPSIHPLMVLALRLSALRGKVSFTVGTAAGFISSIPFPSLPFPSLVPQDGRIDQVLDVHALPTNVQAKRFLGV